MSDAEGERLLDRFGELYSSQVDGVLKALQRNLEQMRSPLHPKDKALQLYLAEAEGDKRSIKIAQIAIQEFAHRLFARLDESDTFGLFAKSAIGELVNLKDYSDCFPEETNIWHEKSGYGSVTNDLLALTEHLM